MPHITPRLNDIMLKGYHSGLRWETKGYNRYDSDGEIVHVHRFLLHHPHSTHLAKTLFRKLETRTRGVIAECLSDIYNLASDHVHLCEHMEPQAFWAHAKNSWEWSANFKDDAFWAFTYKLFHARALYLDTVRDIYRPKGHPLVNALDRFRNCFYNRYGPEAASTPTLGQYHSPEAPGNAEEKIVIARKICHAYFQYAQVDSEGDETDRAISTVVQADKLDPHQGKYAPKPRLTKEVAEDSLGFFIDLGPRNPRHGHKDAYQEIEEALQEAKEEDRQARMQDMEATGLEDDMMMANVNEDQDCIGDVGMGGLGI
ncbi:hypothetical protein F4824DRAFT_469906 [Ustulina deusta]|nr:hypothetical protein F4824DRAFT_469906 [Ustulina deusta]